MGLVTLSVQNRLFWLGRYSERAYMGIEFTEEQYDRLIDGTGRNHREFCEDLGIECISDDAEDYMHQFIFNEAYPPSIASSIENMLGNGMVLRSTISTPTLAYLQMAKNALDIARESDGPAVQFQWIQDDIMAFRGSLSYMAEDDEIEHTVHLGSLVERISLMIRLEYQIDRLDAELRKLLNTLYKVDIGKNQKSLDLLISHVIEHKEVDRMTLLNCVEGLFTV